MTRPPGQVVCVVGVGRSGTSLLVKLLSSMGVYFGVTEHLRGYEPTEHRGFREINAAILERFGGSSDQPPLQILHTGWERLACLDDLKDRARRLIHQEFRAAQIWGWKTPSTVWVLPFWQSLFPEMTYILCVRNPLDVARSYQRFRRFPLQKTMSLWLLGTALAIEQTRPQNRLTVIYEDLLTSPDRELHRLARFLGLGDLSSEARRHTESMLRADLWHHRSAFSELLSSREVPSIGASFYVLLRALAWLEREGSPDLPPGIEDAAEALIQQIKRDYAEQPRALRTRMLRALGTLMKPVVPERLKRHLIVVRDRLMWS